MTSHDDDRLDFNKLQKELDSAVEQDARYWRENDAKIRAVSEQRVATYEEFKDMVAASHLKPLNKGEQLEKMNEISKHPWNPAAARNAGSTISSAGATLNSNQKDETKIPKTSQEFTRDWQRCTKTVEERYNYLLNCGAPLLADMFKTEVSVLGDILAALTVFEENKLETVLEILYVLKAASRFSLSLQFLSKKEKEVCVQLFNKLLEISAEDKHEHLKEKVLELKSVYLP